MIVDGRSIQVTIVPLGPANLVLARTDSGGILACGAVDPAALARLGIPAARVRPTRGPSIADGDDLLAGVVTEGNTGSAARGVKPGMTGREAITRL
ncbi:MAG: DUF1805 domain-containing protein [Actinomycetales bacterium]|nr:DUF1805 domain-containing protein [Actinomycetales bacterium]